MFTTFLTVPDVTFVTPRNGNKNLQSPRLVNPPLCHGSQPNLIGSLRHLICIEEQNPMLINTLRGAVHHVCPPISKIVFPHSNDSFGHLGDDFKICCGLRYGRSDYMFVDGQLIQALCSNSVPRGRLQKVKNIRSLSLRSPKSYFHIICSIAALLEPASAFRKPLLNCFELLICSA